VCSTFLEVNKSANLLNEISINLDLAIADDGCVQKRSKTGKSTVRYFTQRISNS